MIEELREKPLEDRLEFYNFITTGCTHLYSKGKFQDDKFMAIAPAFIKFAKDDPIFMAHLLSWAMKKESKDLQVVSTFFNGLSDADGTPFFKGSNKNKPNFRSASSAAIQMMAPNLALRVLELTRFKFGVKDYLTEAGHYPTTLGTALRKYILYRESNPDMIRGLKTAGLGNKFKKMYKLLHMAPTIETAAILGWKQKGRIIEKISYNLSELTWQEAIEKIKKDKISPIVALSSVPTINAPIAKALLERCTGNQAIILQNMFRNRGFLDIPEIKELFVEKVKTAKTVVDRIDTLAKDLSDEDKKEMSEVRSKVRKEQFGKVGKIYMHIDGSSSMSGAIEFAKEAGAIIAECVNDPQEDFAWGVFRDGTRGRTLKLPDEFTKEGFHQALYGLRADAGGTNCAACYGLAREFGAEVDIYVTDQQHNTGNFIELIKKFTEFFPRPKASLIVNFSSDIVLGHFRRSGGIPLQDSFEKMGIPYSILKPEAVKSSALVAQAIATAIKGMSAIIDEIMDIPILRLPRWYNDPSLEEDYKERMK